MQENELDTGFGFGAMPANESGKQRNRNAIRPNQGTGFEDSDHSQSSRSSSSDLEARVKAKKVKPEARKVVGIDPIRVKSKVNEEPPRIKPPVTAASRKRVVDSDEDSGTSNGGSSLSGHGIHLHLPSNFAMSSTRKTPEEHSPPPTSPRERSPDETKKRKRLHQRGDEVIAARPPPSPNSEAFWNEEQRGGQPDPAQSSSSSSSSSSVPGGSRRIREEHSDSGEEEEEEQPPRRRGGGDEDGSVSPPPPGPAHAHGGDIHQAADDLMANGGQLLGDGGEEGEMGTPKFSFLWRQAQQALGQLPANHWTSCLICKISQMEDQSVVEQGAMSKVFSYYFSKCSLINEIMLAQKMSEKFEKLVRKPGNISLEKRKLARMQRVLARHNIAFDPRDGYDSVRRLQLPEEVAEEVEDIKQDFDSKKIAHLPPIVVFAHYRLHNLELYNTLLTRARDYRYQDYVLEQQSNYLTWDKKLAIDNATFKMKAKNSQDENKFYCSKFSNPLFQPNLDTERAVRNTLAGPPEALSAMNPTAWNSISVMVKNNVNLYSDFLS